MKIVKRTFAAKAYDKNSETRKLLNTSPITSEYMPSYKWVLVDRNDNPTPFAYRTKTEAEIGLTKHEEAEFVKVV